MANQSKGDSDYSLLVLGSDLVVDASSFCVKTDQPREENSSFRFTEDDFSDLEQLQFVGFAGVDRKGRRIVRIVGKYLPATVIDRERLKVYVERKLVDGLGDASFIIVYFNSRVDRGENSPGMLTLRQIYENLPQELRKQLGAIYVVHPGFRSRVLLATVGRFFLSEGFYSKVEYISRVEFLWDYLKKGQVEVPEFVHEHDAELEYRPLMDYGLELDPQSRIHGSGMGRLSYY